MRRALTSWSVVTAIVAASCLAWSARNGAVGLPALSRAWVRTNGAYRARGYTEWVTTRIVGWQERDDALYYNPRGTRHSRLPNHAYALPGERQEVARLTRLTRATPGSAILPADRVRRLVADVHALSARWLWPFARDVSDGRDRVTVTDLYRFALVLAAASLLYAAARVVFFAAGANNELRYLAERSPSFELTATLVAAELLARLPIRRRSNLARRGATT